MKKAQVQQGQNLKVFKQRWEEVQIQMQFLKSVNEKKSTATTSDHFKKTPSNMFYTEEKKRKFNRLKFLQLGKWRKKIALKHLCAITETNQTKTVEQ